jgi:hypothetical protein
LAASALEEEEEEPGEGGGGRGRRRPRAGAGASSSPSAHEGTHAAVGCTELAQTRRRVPNSPESASQRAERNAPPPDPPSQLAVRARRDLHRRWMHRASSPSECEGTRAAAATLHRHGQPSCHRHRGGGGRGWRRPGKEVAAGGGDLPLHRIWPPRGLCRLAVDPTSTVAAEGGGGRLGKEAAGSLGKEEGGNGWQCRPPRGGEEEGAVGMQKATFTPRMSDGRGATAK